MAGPHPFDRQHFKDLRYPSRYWRQLSIGSKFKLSFGVLLALMILLGITGYGALRVVRNQTESAIVTSMKIQAHILEMDRRLQEARTSSRDFLLQYPKMGFSKARDVYVPQTLDHIHGVVKLTTELQRLISESNVNQALKKNNVNVNFYLSSAERYSDTFRELVALVTELAAEPEGLQARLSQLSSAMSRAIRNTGSPGLQLLFNDVQVYEKAYLFSHQPSTMYSAFNASFELQNEIMAAPDLDGDTKAILASDLENFKSIAERMMAVHSRIRSMLNDFELQAKYLDPISNQLMDHAKTDIDRSLVWIRRVSGWAVWGLAGICLAGLGVAVGIGILLNKSITRNMVLLTRAAGEIKGGNLLVKAEIDAADEVGTLADSFNSMAERVHTLVNHLEDEVAQRTRRLESQAEELKAAKDAAEAASQSKSLFLANMSHEIRTPMNSILGFSEILKTRIKDPQLSHFLESIQTSGNSLLSLINDILDLSKVEAGKLELAPSPVSPVRLFMEMETIFGRKIRDKGLELSIQIAPGLPGALLLDESRLRQILINLMGNSVKFTDRGHIRLGVDFSCPEGPAGAIDLLITVEDTGVGIPPDQFGAIFEAFTQAKNMNVSRFGGTGLGLAITKRLIDIMDGRIRVESEPGKGTAFHIVLKGVAVSDMAAPGHSVEMDFDSIEFQAATLMVADDLENNRAVVTGFLADWPFTIREAENGRQVLEQAGEEPPDLILLDMIMPIMDGYETVARLKADPELKDIPVIAVTASAMKGDEEVKRKQCDGFLAKPITKSGLVRELMRFIAYTRVRPGADASPDTPEIHAPDVIPPPREMLTTLYQLADMGNFGQILTTLQGLEAQGESYAPFADKVKGFAREYQAEELMDFLTSFLDDNL